MKKNLLVLFFSVSFSFCFSQTTFQRTYGGALSDESKYIQQTADGGYVFVGSTSSFGAGGSDIYLVKTKPNGDIAWAKSYGGLNNDNGESVVQTSDSGYFITGFTTSFGVVNGNPEVIYFKTDSLGNVVWAKTIGGAGYDLAFSGQQTSEGGYIVFGWTETYGAGQGDYYLIKTNAIGDTLWTKTYGWPGDEYGIDVQQTADHGYIMTGTTNSWATSPSFDMLNIKADSVGGVMWARTYGGAMNDGGVFVRQTSDSGYITVGNTLSFGSGSNDIYLVRTNANGDTTWTRAYGNTGKDGGDCVRQIADGNFIVSGNYNSGATSQGSLMKVDGNGDTLWTRGYGGAMTDEGFAFCVTKDGYALGGYTTSFGAGAEDFYLIKTDSLGYVSCYDTTQNVIYITKPPTIISSQVPLVMAGGIMSNPILTIHNGGVEDTLCSSAGKLVALFESSDSTFCSESGECIYFTDLSTGNPTSWKWSFPGAVPDSSTSQNPTNICYYVPGTYPVTLIVSDFATSDTLTVSPMIVFASGAVAPVITISGDSLCSDSACAYQWYHNGNPIPGATNQCYVITDSCGVYNVYITDCFGCSRLSNIPYYDPCAGVNELQGQIVQVFPNPVEDYLTISIEGLLHFVRNDVFDLIVYNILGEKVYSSVLNRKQETVNCNQFPPGLYIIEITADNKIYRSKFVKE